MSLKFMKNISGLGKIRRDSTVKTTSGVYCVIKVYKLTIVQTKKNRDGVLKKFGSPALERQLHLFSSF